ncbi:hypothetical protein [Staphylococcus lutrae]|uniref:Uncharacterized protein n=1 Tax=Staphylococcus lutrae TaxID=155085 RepID=A0AAC9RPJ0_9STAP|nr:hypothetical protein [Staphylococcus lutrae]ARJ51126.1 hypothetical protein B5P37_07325 [Staphylococcus lutrae]PNZ34815.1 hypothetical protein CD134_09970 [Staphylococcus lutrae]
MKFSKEAVQHYLTLVQDDNPIHVDIVPGQFVVEKVWQILGRDARTYQVVYKCPIWIDEALDIEGKGQTIRVVNKKGDEKLVIRWE